MTWAQNFVFSEVLGRENDLRDSAAQHHSLFSSNKIRANSGCSCELMSAYRCWRRKLAGLVLLTGWRAWAADEMQREVGPCLMEPWPQRQSRPQFLTLRPSMKAHILTLRPRDVHQKVNVFCRLWLPEWEVLGRYFTMKSCRLFHSKNCAGPIFLWRVPGPSAYHSRTAERHGLQVSFCEQSLGPGNRFLFFFF